MGTAPPTGPAPAGDRTQPRGSAPGFAIDAAQLSHVGSVRTENQDACGAFRDPSGWRLFVVADGMGGHRGGATASRMCVEALGREFETSDAPIRQRLVSGLQAANRSIRDLAAESPDLGGMGTTAVALALSPQTTGWVAWVGDSRAYRLRDGKLEALTEDHSLVAEWVRLAVIRPEEAHDHPRRNELLRSVGPLEQLQVDAEPLEVRAGDRYLLCSDGLWGEVTEPEIAAVLGFEEPERAVARLVDLANSRGAPDNVTVQIAAVGVRGRPARPAAPASGARSRLPLWLTGGAIVVAGALTLLLWIAATRESVPELAPAPQIARAEEELEPQAPAEPESEPAAAPAPEESAAALPPPLEEPVRVEASRPSADPVRPESAPAEPAVAPAPPPAGPMPVPEPLAAKPPPVAEPPAATPPPLPEPRAVSPKPTPRPPDLERVATKAPPATKPAAATPPPAAAPTPPPEFGSGAQGIPLGERRFVEAPLEPGASAQAETGREPTGVLAAAARERPTSAAVAPPGGDADAKVRAFLEQWARAIRSRDFALHQRLGLPSSRVEFEQRYPVPGGDVAFDVLEHETPRAGEHRVRIRLSYAFDSGAGARRLQAEERMILRERFGVLRYSSRWQ